MSICQNWSYRSRGICACYSQPLAFRGAVANNSPMNVNLGALQRIDARSVFSNEARDFTPWLRENLGLLGAALGMDLDIVDSEVRVGPFAADLVATDVANQRTVVIENQLEATDHSHLGQVLTYGTGLGATVFVWISPEFRDEHRAALDWLNEHSDEDSLFYGVEVELLKIDDSRPAPNFKLVSYPNEVRKEGGGGTSRPPSEREAAYRHFFEELLSLFKAQYPGQTNVSRVGHESWLSLSVGRSGVTTGWSFTIERRFRTELSIDTEDAALNKQVFDQLLSERASLDEAMGAELEWDYREGRRACRVYSYYPQSPISITDGEDVLEPLSSWAAAEMMKVRQVLAPRALSLLPRRRA
jgi:hypothetical protein